MLNLPRRFVSLLWISFVLCALFAFPIAQLTAQSQSVKFSVSSSENSDLRWEAQGQVNKLHLSEQDDLVLKLDMQLETVDVSPVISDIEMLGRLLLMPIGANATQSFTRTNLPLSTTPEPILLSEAIVLSQQIVRVEDKLLFSFLWRESVVDLPLGTYTPLFEGYIRIDNSDWVRWENSPNLVLTLASPKSSLSAFPLILTIDEDQPYLPISTFDNGSPNMLSISPPILSPGEHSIEPILHLASGDVSFVEEIFEIPGGQLKAKITQPDGRTEDLFPAMITEFLRVDDNSYRLRANSPLYSSYNFDAYGDYIIELSGFLEDIQGQVYQLSHQQHVLIAEPITIQPTVLAGTPFEMGDHFHIGLNVAPAFIADVEVNFYYTPLNNSEMIQQTFVGKTNTEGYFSADESVTLNSAGEYLVDYHVRFVDEGEKWWVGSFQSAGVIGDSQTSLVLHGKRGLEGYDRAPEARFNTDVYPYDDPQVYANLFLPYFSGDVARFPITSNHTILPVMTIQDTIGEYAGWVETKLDGSSEPAPLDELPIMDEQSYIYITANQSTNRVFEQIQGSRAMPIPIPINRFQDTTLFFGGAVVRVPEDDIFATSIYASLITPDDQNLTTQVTPPFITGDDVPAFIFSGQATDGKYATGDTIAVVGQVVPPIETQIEARLISPSQEEVQFSGSTNAIGYFYMPEYNVIADEAGVWQLEITSISQSIAGDPITNSQTFFIAADVPFDSRLNGVQNAQSISTTGDIDYSPPDLSVARPFVSGTSDITRFGRVVTANMLSNAVSIIEPWQGAVIAEVEVGEEPISVAVTPDSTRALVVNRMSGTVSVIDIQTFEILVTYPVGALPYAIVTGANNTAYISLQSTHQVVHLDLATGNILARMAVPEFPAGLAWWGNYLYVTHLWNGQFTLIDLTNNEVLKTIHTGIQVSLSQAIEIDPVAKRAYLPGSISNQQTPSPPADNTVLPIINIVDLETMTLLPDERIHVSIADRAVNMPFASRLDAPRRRLYVANAGSNSISVIDLDTGLAEANIEVGANPRNILLRSDRTLVYVQNAVDETLSVIDPQWLTVSDTMPISSVRVDLNTFIGAKLFFDATDERLTVRGMINCASCHFQGQSDGRVWRDAATPALTTIEADVNWLENHVLDYSYGSGFLDGDNQNSVDLEALIEYMKSFALP